MTTSSLQQLKSSMEAELRQDILPFWMKYTVDRENGGFIGALSNDLVVDNEAPRSQVLCARILWTYSAAFTLYHDPAYLSMAQHAFRYLSGPFLDGENGGFYWWIDKYGQPVNDRKQSYGQAFAIYGLSEYYRASGDEAALELAQATFDLLEQYARDPLYGGYVEGCARNWGTLPDMRLSEKEEYNSPKSMNTLLHMVEGYTSLLRSWRDPRLVEAQTALLTAFLDHVVDPRTHFTRLFFQMDWTPVGDHISYGHDIETSWLLVEAAEVLSDEALIERAKATARRMAEAVYCQGIDPDGSILYEGSPRGLVMTDKSWWVQAEGIVGFTNAAHLCVDNPALAEKYTAAALRLWDYIEERMIDRQYGEWYKILDREGRPWPNHPKTGPWECPYHHARACMEMIARIP